MGKPIFSRLALFCLIILTGCEGLDFLGRKSATATVPESPFGNNQATAASPARPASTQAPAAVAVAARVDALGRRVLAANPQIAAKPLFNTIGTPQPALFHKGTSDIYITEGLVKQCATEGQLAALLCHELGAMVSEREALAGPVKGADPGPPVEVRVGTDSGGAFGPADQTRLAELGKYEREHSRPTGPVKLPPDANVLARTYLIRAKFPPNELDAVAALLTAASRDSALEKQLRTPPLPNAALPATNDHLPAPRNY